MLSLIWKPASTHVELSSINEEHLEKLAFRGALRGLSIGGRIINQWLTPQVSISLPPNPHPVEVFRCSLKPSRDLLTASGTAPAAAFEE